MMKIAVDVLWMGVSTALAVHYWRKSRRPRGAHRGTRAQLYVQAEELARRNRLEALQFTRIMVLR